MPMSRREFGFLGMGIGVGISAVIAISKLSTSQKPLKAKSGTAEMGNRLQNIATGTLSLGMVALGDKLKLYDALLHPTVVDEGLTSTDLATRTELKERWVREWACQQASAGFLLLDCKTKKFSVNPAARPLLTRNGKHSFLPMASLIWSTIMRSPGLVKSFKTGIGSDYDGNGIELSKCMARMHVPAARNVIIPSLLPQLQNGAVIDALKKGCLVADIGCSGAEITIEFAAAFPNSEFHAFDVADSALKLAEANIKDSGLSNVKVHDALKNPPSVIGKFDFIYCHDVLHDLTHPQPFIAEARKAIKDNGTWLIIDIINSGDYVANVGTPMSEMMFGFSVNLCMSSGLSASDGSGIGLGTMGFTKEIAQKMLSEERFELVKCFNHPGLPVNQIFEIKPKLA